MNDLIAWINTNKDWLFSGVGIVLIGRIWSIVKENKKKKINLLDRSNNLNNVHSSYETEQKEEKTLDDYKNKTKILFIDDENFKVVTILKNAGWVHTKRLKDCRSLDMSEIKEADILIY